MSSIVAHLLAATGKAVTTSGTALGRLLSPSNSNLFAGTSHLLDGSLAAHASHMDCTAADREMLGSWARRSTNSPTASQ